MKEHVTKLKVRFSEVDLTERVYFPNFYVWADSIAFIEYFVSLGLPFTELQKRQIDFVIGESSCRFSAPAQFDDLVEIHTSIKELKDKTVTFQFKFFKGNELLATCHITYICFAWEGNKLTGKSTKIPQDIVELMKAGA